MDMKYSKLNGLLSLILFLSAGLVSAEADTGKNLDRVKLYYYDNDICNTSMTSATAFYKTVYLKKKSYVLIKVSSEVHATDGGDGQVTAEFTVSVDGAQANGPRFFSPPVDGSYSTFTGNYWIGKLSKGRHTIAVYFWDSDLDDVICVGYRTLEVHYEK